MDNPIDMQIEVWKQTENLWLIKVERGGTFEKPDGSKIQMYYGEYLIDPNVPLVKVDEVKTLTHYQDSECNRMSVELYQMRVSELLSGATNQDEIEDGYTPTFDDIDLEYAYKKFIQTWKPEYSVEVLKTPISFTKIHEVPKAVNEFISPKRKSTGDPKDTLFLYEYRKHTCKVIKDELGDIYELEDLERLEFVKIDGKYLSIECKKAEPFIKNPKETLTLTREDCVEKYKQVDETFRQILREWRGSRSVKLRDTKEFNEYLTEIVKLSNNSISYLNGRHKKVEEAVSSIRRKACKLLEIIKEIEKFDKPV